jgi:hypothetical protein
MPDGAFTSFLAAVDKEGFSDGKLGVVRSVAANNRFTIGQLGRLMDELPFPADKVEAARILAPRILDPENAWKLSEHLAFSADKEAVSALFRR